MTSVVQPVDAAIGRSFNAAFGRLLINHVLKFVNDQMKEPPETRKPFKLTQAVTIYDTVRMMATPWNLVPLKVVVNGWLSCSIIAPYQEEELRSIKELEKERVKVAKLPPYGTPLRSECELYDHISRDAKEQGEKYLRAIAEKNQ